ncbi:reverse transcriptase domain-containing protein [Tanacetum coccineum]
MVGTPKKENLDRYCDYHREKEHYTNDCYQLKRQLEAALESGKLSHLVKDVRQRGNNRGRQQGNSNTNGKIINMIRVRGENRKRSEKGLIRGSEKVSVSGDDPEDSRRQQGSIRKANLGYGRSPQTDHPTLLKCELEHYSGGTKIKGFRSEEKQGSNKRSGRMGQGRHSEAGQNVNLACPKDYYPLPEIGLKIEAVIGFPFKCFLDSYKGTVGSELRGICGRHGHQNQDGTLEDNGHSKDIRQPPEGQHEVKPKEVLIRSKGRKIPRLHERAFQEMKKLIIELPKLTTPNLKETLYVYLAASKDAVSGVLVADLKGKRTPIRYVSRTLHDADKNYAPLEKLALCLLYLSQRLCRASSSKGVGVGLILIDPTRTEYTYAIRLNIPSTNNEAKYEALLAGLRIAEKMKVRTLKVKVDSKLVACQLNGEFVTSSEGMTKYLTKAKEQVALFKWFLIENIPQNQNQKANVLSKLASVAFNHLTKEVLVEVLNTKSVDVQEVSTIIEEKEDNWMTQFIKFLEEGIWLVDENEARTLRIKISQYVIEEERKEFGYRQNEARTLRIKISQYVIEEEVMFKKSYLSPMLRCVGPLQANYIIREVHEGARGRHAGARSVVAKIMRQGYYWPSMYRDTKEVADKCDSCQMHALVPRLPKTRVIVTDNGTQLVNDPFKSWCEKWKIKQMNTAVAHPQVNGLVERSKKSLIYGLKARLGQERVGWVDELPTILWTHRTMLKTSNGEIPFSLTYGSKAVIPAEIGMPTYRTIQLNEAQNEEEMRLNLDLIQERRETTTIREAKYKKKVEQYYNKWVRLVSFRVGNFVYRRNEASRVKN